MSAITGCYRAAILSLLMGVLPSCFQPGGGGFNQTSPETVRAGEPAILTLEAYVWGAGGPIAGRCTQVAAFYRLTGSTEYQKVLPTLVSQNDKRELYRFTIPPFPAGTEGQIEFYFEVKLDGYLNHINGLKKITITG